MKIYALSDEKFTPNELLFASIKRLCNGGASMIQYRNKSGSHNEKELSKISEFCASVGVSFIINDDALLAKRVGAAGVHVGKDDGGVGRARDILGANAIIGASCYDSCELAIKAQNEGASYAAFGAVFSSPTKPNATCCGLKVISKAKELLKVPVCAIGGINASNIASVAKAGADYAAVVSALYTKDQIEQNLLELKRAIKI